MLKQRILTALILFISLFGILFFSSTPVFAGFLGVMLLVSAWEWANLCNIDTMWKRMAYAVLSLLFGLSCWWVMDRQVFSFWTLKSVLILAAFWWTIALLWVQSYPSSSVLWSSQPVRMLMGLLVLLPSWLGMTYLHSMNSGWLLVLSVVVIVATADTGAYFAGKAFGKRKLAPNVSPGKSWEGVIGGFTAVAVLGVLFSVFQQREDVWVVLAIILPTALVSVLGDLLESMLKRHRGIKDSSQLLPGHGGVLDRVDGLVAAVPVFSLAVLVSGWQW